MAVTKPIRDRITALKAEFDTLRKGKESLLVMLDEAEVPESVYNSNAIENSTLTLKETEKILLDMEVSRDISVREVFEAYEARRQGRAARTCRVPTATRVRRGGSAVPGRIAFSAPPGTASGAAAPRGRLRASGNASAVPGCGRSAGRARPSSRPRACW